MMNCLIVHTATDLCAVTVLKKQVAYEQSLNQARVHGKKILPMIDAVLQESRLRIKDIDYFMVTQGPDSFTGIRIGMSIMRAFAVVFMKPLVTFSTLELYAQSALTYYDTDSVSVAIDARMSQVYWAQYKNEQGRAKACAPIQLIKSNNISSLLKGEKSSLGVGEGFSVYQHCLEKLVVKTEVTFIPKLSHMAALMVKKITSNQLNDNVEPLYGREKVV